MSTTRCPGPASCRSWPTGGPEPHNGAVSWVWPAYLGTARQKRNCHATRVVPAVVAPSVMYMRETTGDLFELASCGEAWLVVTVNGSVGRDGKLVMGAGVAGQAARTWPHLPELFGRLVTENGNVPVADVMARVITWPTKPDVHELDGHAHPGWMCVARTKRPECTRQVARLVWRNAPAVAKLATELGIDGPIYTPRPGCGLGGLEWAKVGPALAEVLDDRFVVVAQGRQS